jgi:hypothetical protein
MKYTYNRKPLPASTRVEWTLFRDGEPVVTDIAADWPSAGAAAFKAGRFFQARDRQAQAKTESSHVAG